MRATWVFACVVALCAGVACSGESDGSADDDGASGGGSAPTGGSENGGGTGGANGGSAGMGGSAGSSGSSGSGGNGGGECGCVESEIRWGMNGGFVAYMETSTLSPCATFFHSRDPAGGTGPSIVCMQEITSCAGGVGPSSVAEALADSDVRAAVASAPVLYGHDLRPVDGQVLRIEIDGEVIEIGQECGTTANCTPIPDGVAEIAELLNGLTDQELARGQCADAFGE